MRFLTITALTLGMLASAAVPGSAAPNQIVFSVPIAISSPVSLTKTNYPNGQVRCSVLDANNTNLGSGTNTFSLASPPQIVLVGVLLSPGTPKSYVCALSLANASGTAALDFYLKGADGGKFLSDNNLNISSMSALVSGNL